MMILIKVEQYGSTFEDDCDYSLPTYILQKQNLEGFFL